MLNIDLSFENEEIHVVAKFILDNYATNISFSLNKTLKIINITDEYKNKYIPMCEEANFRFHPQLNKYTINFKCNTKVVTIEYKGSIFRRSHNLISDDCIALNWYSTWYPQKPFDVVANLFSDTTVKIYGAENYNVVKGIREGDIWIYKPIDYDLNIIALKNYIEVKYDALSFRYLKDYENSISQKYKEYIGKIINYYRKIYEFETLPHMDIIVLPNTNPYDGYVRKKLIVLGGFCEDILQSIKVLAHEIAHIWCTGADTCSWEDWLNETFAEWSALLFIFDSLGVSEFEKIINLHRKDNLPPIKTDNGERPNNGVHDKGTLMLYELYLLYGKELIVKLLRIFHNLKIKSTSEFICALENNNLSDIARYIENAICS